MYPGIFLIRGIRFNRDALLQLLCTPTCTPKGSGTLISFQSQGGGSMANRVDFWISLTFSVCNYSTCARCDLSMATLMWKGTQILCCFTIKRCILEYTKKLPRPPEIKPISDNDHISHFPEKYYHQKAVYSFSKYSYSRR